MATLRRDGALKRPSPAPPSLPPGSPLPARSSASRPPSASPFELVETDVAGRQDDLRVAGVASCAAGAAAAVAGRCREQQVALPGGGGQPGEKGRRPGRPGGACVVVGRAMGHQRPHELGEGAGYAVPGDGRAAEGALEERGIEGGRGEPGLDLVERRAHLDGVLDRRQHLGLEGLGPFVPEEPATGVVAGVGEAHRVAAGRPPVEADAHPPGVREPVSLAVARPARDAAVGRQPGVVEQHPAEGGAGVGDGVVGRCVVGRADAAGAVRGAEVRRQLDGVPVRG